MRNLVATKDRSVGLALPEELGEASKFAVDSDGGLLFIAGTGLGVAACTTADGEVGGRFWCMHEAPAVPPIANCMAGSRDVGTVAPACRLPPPAACRQSRASYTG